MTSAAIVFTGCGHAPVGTKSNSTRSVANIEVDENYVNNAQTDDEEIPEYQLPNQSTQSHQPDHSTYIAFDWPVNSARLTRGYIPHPTGKRRKPHLGLDLAAPKGTPIFAAHDGTVIYVGREFKGYGRMIMVEGKKGLATLYAHLSKSLIHTGDYVHQGDQIGEMGRTGRASGVHLHFEIRTENGPVDPLLYLPSSRVAKNND